MNLFEVFRDGVLRYLKRVHGLDGIDRKLNQRLVNELNVLKPAYFNHAPIDYSSWERKVAYSLHFAPKHAIVWREYILRMKTFLDSVQEINAIGCGPGSELIGIASASQLDEGSVIQYRTREQEASWDDLFENIMYVFNKRAPVGLAGYRAEDLKELLPDTPVVGSCVLSELGRERRIKSFRRSIHKSLGPVAGRFMDLAIFPRDDGTSPFIQDMIPNCTVHKLYKKNWDLMKTVNEEMDACNPLYVGEPLTKEPGLVMHVFKFSA